jgi:hypothetical protein
VAGAATPSVDAAEYAFGRQGGARVALFELIVAGPADVATVREVRKRGASGITDIVHRIQAGEPVITVSTTDYPRELDIEEGHRRQHSRLPAAHAALVELGHPVVIRYKASSDARAEVVDLTMAIDLMRSELSDLAQEHD